MIKNEESPTVFGEQTSVLKTEHLEKTWVLVTYRVPVSTNDERNNLCHMIKKYGLHPYEKRGGSVYVGPRNSTRDQVLQNEIDRVLEASPDSDIHVLTGDFDEINAEKMRSGVVKYIFEDLDSVESTIKELEKAMAGEITLIKTNGKEKDLLSTGTARLLNATILLNEVEQSAFRYQANNMTTTSEQILIRIRQMRAWLTQVDAVFKRWATVERRRRKASAN